MIQIYEVYLKKKKQLFLFEKLFCLFSFSLAFYYHLEQTCLSKTGCMETSMKDNYSSRKRMFALIQRSYRKHGIIFERVVMSEEIRAS